MIRFRSIIDFLFIRAPGDLMILFGMIGICLSVFVAIHESPGQFPWDVAGGNGTNDHPYLIATCDQLENISKDAASAYALASDVDCSATAKWEDGHGFFPIGYYGAGFTGTFDGRGYAIKKLTIQREAMDYVALFGKLGTGAVVHNLTVDVHIVGHNEVAAIAGWSTGGVIESVRVDGDITGMDAVGGVVAVNDGVAKDAIVHAGIRGQKWVGGIAGLDYEKSVIKNVTVSGDVAGDNNIGGVVGISRGSTIDGCNIDANVMGVTNVGGAVGWLIGGKESASSLLRCIFTGTIRGAPSGSIVGARGA